MRRLSKALYGVRASGLRRTLQGLVELVRLRRCKPALGTVVTTPNGLVVHFRYPEQLVNSLVLFGKFLEPEYDLLPRVLSKDMVFFDVGAGIGAYSLHAATTPVSEIHAFEPVPLNVESTRANLRANGIEGRVILNACALSSKEGHGRMVSSSNLFGSILTSVGDEDEEGGVPVTTLDCYCMERGVAAIDFLKIDAEGHELNILQGAEALLRADRIGVMVLETSPRHVRLYEALRGRGFEFFYYDPSHAALKRIRPLSRKALESSEPTAFSSNIVLVHRRRLEEVERRLLASGGGFVPMKP